MSVSSEGAIEITDLPKSINEWNKILGAKADAKPIDHIGIDRWGVKPDLVYRERRGGKEEGEVIFEGDAFIFRLVVPEKYINNGDLELKIQGTDRPGEIIFFKFRTGGRVRYTHYRPGEIKPHYLGLLSNGLTLVEMICPYRTEDLGDIHKFIKDIQSGETKMEFSIC